MNSKLVKQFIKDTLGSISMLPHEWEQAIAKRNSELA